MTIVHTHIHARGPGTPCALPSPCPPPPPSSAVPSPCPPQISPPRSDQPHGAEPVIQGHHSSTRGWGQGDPQSPPCPQHSPPAPPHNPPPWIPSPSAPFPPPEGHGPHGQVPAPRGGGSREGPGVGAAGEREAGGAPPSRVPQLCSTCGAGWGTPPGARAELRAISPQLGTHSPGGAPPLCPAEELGDGEHRL